MRNHSYDLHQPTDSFHDNQTHFYMKGFTQRLVLKQRHKDTFIHELLTGAFDFKLNYNVYDYICKFGSGYTNLVKK